jgi:hypothetical protein
MKLNSKQPSKSKTPKYKNFAKSMEPLINPKSQPSKVTSLVKDLNTSLTALQPNQSQTTRLITYALIAAAVVGITVYHYIREQERSL